MSLVRKCYRDSVSASWDRPNRVDGTGCALGTTHQIQCECEERNSAHAICHIVIVLFVLSTWACVARRHTSLHFVAKKQQPEWLARNFWEQRSAIRQSTILFLRGKIAYAFRFMDGGDPMFIFGCICVCEWVSCESYQRISGFDINTLDLRPHVHNSAIMFIVWCAQLWFLWAIWAFLLSFFSRCPAKVSSSRTKLKHFWV